MSASFEYTRGDFGGNIFLPRVYGNVTDEQYRYLGYLHMTAVERGDADMASPHGVAGGWNLTGYPETFEKLAGIATAILNKNYQPYLDYEREGQS